MAVKYMSVTGDCEGQVSGDDVNPALEGTLAIWVLDMSFAW